VIRAAGSYSSRFATAARKKLFLLHCRMTTLQEREAYGRNDDPLSLPLARFGRAES